LWNFYAGERQWAWKPQPRPRYLPELDAITFGSRIEARALALVDRSDPLRPERRPGFRSNGDRLGPLVPALAGQLRAAILGLAALSLLTGAVFPLVLYAIARTAFPDQAGGSLLRDEHGAVVGSRLIGQVFAAPGDFHTRPSAAGAGYDATASGGSNLGPSEPALNLAIRRRLVAYRRENGLAADAVVPIDAVTASASGLDPQISPADADLQVARVARARGLDPAAVRALVAEHTRGRQFGILAAPRVNVLELNLALDRAARRKGD
jgi:K+-transporting ATPase ATPase C chain